MNKFFWLAAALFLLTSLVFHLVSSNIADLDSFYYFGLADLLKERGLFNVDFPWIYHSVIRNFSVSLWYGFGVLMIPFSYFGVLGIKLAGIFLTTALLLFYFIALKKRQIAGAIFWPFLLFFAAPNTTAHFLMVRPQTVSLILAVPLLFFLTKRKFPGIFLLSFGIAWAHFNFAWLPLAMAGILVVIKFIIERKFVWKKFLCVLGGVAAGWLLRPDPIGAAKLFYIQVLQQILEKQGGLPLLFGKENLPIDSSALFQHFGVFLLIWILAIGVWLYFLFHKKRPDTAGYWQGNDVFVSVAMALSIMFFFFTVAIARRAYDFWVLFGVLGIAVVFTYLYLNFRKTAQLQWIKLALGGAFIFMVFYSGSRTISNLQNKVYPPDYLKEAALWLKNNSEPGDIVFNLHWAHFSPLFYWNRTNYYIGGLDPIFQYSYNPSLYWQFHYLSADAVTKKTCGAAECTKEMLEDTHEVLKRDYNARYVVLNKLQNPAVYSFLKSDAGFEKELETEQEAVYSIK